MAEQFFGIDLGTTNSAISIYTGGGKSQIIPLLQDDGKTLANTLPSCVLWLGGDKWVIGAKALEQRYLPNACYSIKSLIGTDYVHKFKYDGEECQKTPIEISAMILKSLCQRAAYLYPNIRDVTITVPAEFGNKERHDTLEAGKLAGLNVVDIINEPTSAALCYDTHNSKEVLVYDLGGGTFDITALRITSNTNSGDLDLDFKELGICLDDVSGDSTQSYEVVVSGGDRRLGGDNLDSLVLGYVLKDFNQLITDKQLTPLAQIANANIFEKLKYEISKLKLQFCSENPINYAEIDLGIPEYTEHNLKLAIYKKNFIDATEVIYNKTRNSIRQLLTDPKVTASNISEIILVGGSTKNIHLRELIARDFPDLKIQTAINPDESVALGASIKTAIVSGAASTKITDVAPYSIGIEVMSDDENSYNKRIAHLIRKNTRIPYQCLRTYYLDKGQNDLEIKFYIGESIYPHNCTLVATHKIDVNNLKEGILTAKVLINSQGLLTVTIESDGNSFDIELDNILKKEKKTIDVNNMSSKQRNFYRIYNNLLARNEELPEDINDAFNSYFINESDSEAETKINDWWKDSKTSFFKPKG